MYCAYTLFSKKKKKIFPLFFFHLLLFRVSFSELINQVQLFPFGTEGRAVFCLLCNHFYAREEDCIRVTEKSIWVRKLIVANLKYEDVDHPQHVFCRCGMVAGLDEGNLIKIQNFRLVPLMSDFFRPQGLMPKIFYNMAAVFTCLRRSCKRLFAFNTADTLETPSSVIIDSLYAFNIRRCEDEYGTFDVYCVCGDRIGIETSNGKVHLHRFMRTARVSVQIEVPRNYQPDRLVGEIEIESSDSEAGDEIWMIEDSDSGHE